MSAAPDSLRPARPEDHEAIRALLHAAFPTRAEAGLVADLRASGAMELELVMPWPAGPVGYLAFSRMVAPEGWLALAPVAVAPVWAGKRLGTRMVTGAVRLMAIKGMTVVVLGSPTFYARAGFSQSRAEQLETPYPKDFTLIARPGMDIPRKKLIYPKAFEGV